MRSIFKMIYMEINHIEAYGVDLRREEMSEKKTEREIIIDFVRAYFGVEDVLTPEEVLEKVLDMVREGRHLDMWRRSPQTHYVKKEGRLGI